MFILRNYRVREIAFNGNYLNNESKLEIFHFLKNQTYFTFMLKKLKTHMTENFMPDFFKMWSKTLLILHIVFFFNIYAINPKFI